MSLGRTQGAADWTINLHVEKIAPHIVGINVVSFLLHIIISFLAASLYLGTAVFLFGAVMNGVPKWRTG